MNASGPKTAAAGITAAFSLGAGIWLFFLLRWLESVVLPQLGGVFAWGPANALAEVRRYTTTPTQPQSYLMGKLAILELVEYHKSANPGASLREIHDAILGCGSLPPRLMRQRLLG